MLENCVDKAISIDRVLRRGPKDSRVALEESLLDKMNEILYNVEVVTKWLFLNDFLDFFETTKKYANKPQA